MKPPAVQTPELIDMMILIVWFVTFSLKIQMDRESEYNFLQIGSFCGK